MNSMIPFDFNGQDVRTFTKGGDTWFVASDVAKVLEYREAWLLTRLLADDEAAPHNVWTRSESGVRQRREMTLINEPGLYRAIFSSRSGKAEDFRRWVFHDVLPTIRHAGHYATKGGSLDRELQECSIDYSEVRQPLMGRRAITAQEEKLLRGFDHAMRAAGLPKQYNGVAPDPAVYRVTPALDRVAIEFLSVGKQVAHAEAARERLSHLSTA